MKAEDIIHEIGVVEVGFKDESTDKATINRGSDRMTRVKSSCSNFESLSESNQCRSPEMEPESYREKEEEELNAAVLRKLNNYKKKLGE
ncbi:hypothetical protein V6N13_013128 [Hibiscus sabdariffa]|uniref:Uncharacterized protein n=1 Tax=Hibiscus sabdariffa TaxID=183260 RepID=A0ABR2SH90_9ROSI